MPALVTWWTRDIGLLVPDAAGEAVLAVGSGLLERWTEPHRHYHGSRHLVEVFWALAELGRAGLLSEREEAVARVAGWYHDAVYQIAAAGNEARSAALARSELARLGADARDVATVVRLVEHTATHTAAAGDRLDLAFQDADLWILSAPQVRFDEYCRQVRAEYAVVPEAAYRSGRSAILAPLLDRETIYRTAHARQSWEQAARENLARELSRLTG